MTSLADLSTSITDCKARVSPNGDALRFAAKIVIRQLVDPGSNTPEFSNRALLPRRLRNGLARLRAGHLTDPDDPTPSKRAFDRASQMLSELEGAALLPSRVVSSADGGITFIRPLDDGGFVEIECDNDGDASIVLVRPGCVRQLEFVRPGECVAAAVQSLLAH
jgi:hypothetical protein